MKDLRDWYSYLERSARVSTAGSAPSSSASPDAVSAILPVPARSAASAQARSRMDRAKRLSRRRRPGLQEPLPLELGGRTARRPGRPALTETREEIIQRLLDPELSVHEAAALLSVSKATLRRYTDSGKLACYRTAGGQRRFKLSTVLALIESGTGPAPAS
jgi:excisionase family DNA binding protein